MYTITMLFDKVMVKWFVEGYWYLVSCRSQVRAGGMSAIAAIQQRDLLAPDEMSQHLYSDAKSPTNE